MIDAPTNVYGQAVSCLLGVAFLALSACSDADDPSPTPLMGGESLVRDSAGITIVESTRPAWGGGEGWRVAERPDVEIGTVEGRFEYLLSNVRSAWRMDDGRIVVVDEDADEVRFYTRRGRFISASGRDGEGPGEYRGAWTVRAFKSDSLFVYDYQLDRVSILDSEGGFGRAISVEGAGRNFWAMGALEDSLLVLMTPGGGTPQSQRPLGLFTDSTWLLKYHEPRSPVDTLGRYPVTLWHQGGDRRRPESLFFRPYASLAVDGERFLWGLGDRWEFGEYSADGRLTRLVRLPNRAATPLSEERRDRFEHDYPRWVMASNGGNEGSIDFWTRYVEQGVFPDSVPAYSKLVIDSEKNVWAEHYPWITEIESIWTVFDPEGRWLGDMRLPDGLQVEQIGPDFVLGIWVDDMGVNYVRVYELTR